MRSRLPRAAPDGLVAATLLAFLGTAGLFYVNIMAAIVDGLISGMGLGEAQAGRIGSANIYGAAAGALLSVALVRRLPWRALSALCLSALVAIDLASILITSPTLLLAARLVHGVVGGISVGTGLAVIARTASPDRGFGMLLFVQFGLGGLGVLVLPNLVPIYGTAPLFLALAAFSGVTLAMLPFLPDFPPVPPRAPRSGKGGIEWRPFSLIMAAIFCFQAANMALLAYIFRLGLASGLDRGHVSAVLGLATWVALAGPLAVVWLGGKWGRLALLSAAMLLTLAGNFAFHWSGNEAVFLLANCATGITWGFVIPYLFGMAATFDSAGQAAAFAGFVSKMGLATGPIVGGALLGANADYGLMINVAVLVMAVSMALMLAPARLLDRRDDPAQAIGA
jgi:predicted MFS family arabinose efflux permease